MTSDDIESAGSIAEDIEIDIHTQTGGNAQNSSESIDEPANLRHTEYGGCYQNHNHSALGNEPILVSQSYSDHKSYLSLIRSNTTDSAKFRLFAKASASVLGGIVLGSAAGMLNALITEFIGLDTNDVILENIIAGAVIASLAVHPAFVLGTYGRGYSKCNLAIGSIAATLVGVVVGCILGGFNGKYTTGPLHDKIDNIYAENTIVGAIIGAAAATALFFSLLGFDLEKNLSTTRCCVN